MSRRNDTPVCRKLVATVRSGFLALDETVQNEIRIFIKSQQNEKGGFVDRAGNPDLYYSLFGLWLSLATEQIEIQNRLKNFVADINISESKSPVEDLALLLIKSELDSNHKKRGVFSIIKTVLNKGRMIELSYQFFLISLVIDAVGRNKGLYYFFARIWLFFYKPKGNIPCSLNAALVYARKILGLNARNMQKKLETFSVERGGFKAFETVKTADSLSTGVALFVLMETAYDLRVVAPGCLDFIQDNYYGGAFLSGDGDQTKDLEYTFYGLLALGSLLKDE
ncbi:MAG: hypothetical protein Q7U47_06600 [Paludibacter sp.]|nr:hypothetical protein [Paludibacter sp.]